MAKTKDADAGSAKRKMKIPKEIAGVKIPKTLRDSGKAAMKLAQNPMARELLSAGLIATAAAVTANSRARKAARQSGKEAGEALSGAASAASDSATRIGAALVGAAEMAAQRFFGNDADASRDMPPKAPRATPPRDAVPTGDAQAGEAAAETVVKPKPARAKVGANGSAGIAKARAAGAAKKARAAVMPKAEPSKS